MAKRSATVIDDGCAIGTIVSRASRIPIEKIEQTRAIRHITAAMPSVVYAVQFRDGTIKIGCTTQLADRHRHFRGKGGVIVGFCVGDMDDEREIHLRLRPHLAHGREYYNPTPQVLEVVNDMRDEFNLPHIAA